MRAAIYARYSSELQSETSIDDQVAACEAYARRASIAGPFDVYADAAISGASMATRPQLLALLAAVRARRVNVIIAEAIDRLSRDQADVHLIRRACEANGVKLYTIADGEVSGMVAGLQGIMAEAFLKNLGDKTRRGMMGVARAGRIAGGLTYGYRAIEGKPGERAIDEAQANIVRRIFANYIAGVSPHAIARNLNSEGVDGPRGGRWKVNSILGDARVGDGILCNDLYRGRIVFNRRRYVKNPETGKRSSFLNPERDWIITEAPELRIVDDETWQAAQGARRRIQRAPTQNAARRPKLLFSGLLTCARCGSAFIIRNRGRFACSANIYSGACATRESIPAAVIDRRVIGGLKRTLLAPEVIAEAVRAYHDERRAMCQHESKRRTEIERDLAEARRRAARIADQLIDTPSPTLKAKLAEADATIAALEAEAAAIPPASIVEMHPSAPDEYRRLVEGLEAALSADAAPEVKEAVRSLLERIELAPDTEQPDGWSIVLHGDLAAILALTNEKAPGVSAGGPISHVSNRSLGSFPLPAGAAAGRVKLGAGACTGRKPTAIRIAA